MKKINEIFYSLQGEGFHTGTPALFIRFSGCNLKCDFCDTRHEDGKLMSDEEIVEQAAQCPARMVILTGGEPSLFVDDALIEKLHGIGKYVCIETNGTHPVPQSIDWITCSPKGAPIALTRIDEIKVVFTGNNDVEQYAKIPAKVHCLQPCSCKNTAEVVNYIQEHPYWRLSLQTHKWIGIL